MRKVKTCLFIFCLMSVMVFVVSTTVMAENVVPYAHPIFDLTSVMLSNNLMAGFNVQTSRDCDIYVQSVSLQQKEDGKWKRVSSLTLPDKEVYGKRYATTIDYSDEITGSGTYRIYAVFNADGYTLGCPSNEVDL